MEHGTPMVVPSQPSNLVEKPCLSLEESLLVTQHFVQPPPPEGPIAQSSKQASRAPGIEHYFSDLIAFHGVSRSLKRATRTTRAGPYSGYLRNNTSPNAASFRYKNPLAGLAVFIKGPPSIRTTRRLSPLSPIVPPETDLGASSLTCAQLVQPLFPPEVISEQPAQPNSFNAIPGYSSDSKEGDHGYVSSHVSMPSPVRSETLDEPEDETYGLPDYEDLESSCDSVIGRIETKRENPTTFKPYSRKSSRQPKPVLRHRGGVSSRRTRGQVSFAEDALNLEDEDDLEELANRISSVRTAEDEGQVQGVDDLADLLSSLNAATAGGEDEDIVEIEIPRETCTPVSKLEAMCFILDAVKAVRPSN